MRFALVDGQHHVAQRGLVGHCRGCGAEMVPKCGELKIHHWSHKGRRACDPWWENETEWHRTWKDFYPVAWQEIRKQADDGEVHIADVRTGKGMVIEFQHSRIDAMERSAREAFYKSMIWVVDATRLKRDRSELLCQFELSGKSEFERKTGFINTYSQSIRIIREWRNSTMNVLFDIGDDKLIFMPRRRYKGCVLLTRWNKSTFIEFSMELDPTELAQPASEIIPYLRPRNRNYAKATAPVWNVRLKRARF